MVIRLHGDADGTNAVLRLQQRWTRLGCLAGALRRCVASLLKEGNQWSSTEGGGMALKTRCTACVK
jgi:hypothetical protein